MEKPFRPFESPAVYLSAVLSGIWILSWVLFLWLAPGAKLAGLPLLTWCHIALGVGAVVVSVVAIRLLRQWESR